MKHVLFIIFVVTIIVVSKMIQEKNGWVTGCLVVSVILACYAYLVCVGNEGSVYLYDKLIASIQQEVLNKLCGGFENSIDMEYIVGADVAVIAPQSGLFDFGVALILLGVVFFLFSNTTTTSIVRGSELPGTEGYRVYTRGGELPGKESSWVKEHKIMSGLVVLTIVLAVTYGYSVGVDPKSIWSSIDPKSMWSKVAWLFSKESSSGGDLNSEFDNDNGSSRGGSIFNQPEDSSRSTTTSAESTSPSGSILNQPEDSSRSTTTSAESTSPSVTSFTLVTGIRLGARRLFPKLFRLWLGGLLGRGTVSSGVYQVTVSSVFYLFLRFCMKISMRMMSRVLKIGARLHFFTIFLLGLCFLPRKLLKKMYRRNPLMLLMLGVGVVIGSIDVLGAIKAGIAEPSMLIHSSGSISELGQVWVHADQHESYGQLLASFESGSLLYFYYYVKLLDTGVLNDALVEYIRHAQASMCFGTPSKYFLYYGDVWWSTEPTIEEAFGFSLVETEKPSPELPHAAPTQVVQVPGQGYVVVKTPQNMNEYVQSRVVPERYVHENWQTIGIPSREGGMSLRYFLVNVMLISICLYFGFLLVGKYMDKSTYSVAGAAIATPVTAVGSADVGKAPGSGIIMQSTQKLFRRLSDVTSHLTKVVKAEPVAEASGKTTREYVKAGLSYVGATNVLGKAGTMVKDALPTVLPYLGAGIATATAGMSPVGALIGATIGATASNFGREKVVADVAKAEMAMEAVVTAGRQQQELIALETKHHAEAAAHRYGMEQQKFSSYMGRHQKLEDMRQEAFGRVCGEYAHKRNEEKAAVKKVD